MLKYRITIYCILFVLLLSPLLSAANNTIPHYSLTNIKEKIQDFILGQLNSEINKSDLDIEVGLIDSRLRLSQCYSELELSLPQHNIKGGNTTVFIQCDGPKPWSLHVPVIIRKFKKIVVSNRPLQRGSIITEYDLILQKHDIYTLPAGYVEDKGKLIGKIALKNLPAGTALNLRQVDLPTAVKRGQLVALQAKSGSIEVRSTGKALQDGAIGDRIKVRNVKSDRIVEGTVINNQLVDVGRGGK